MTNTKLFHIISIHIPYNCSFWKYKTFTTPTNAVPNSRRGVRGWATCVLYSLWMMWYRHVALCSSDVNASFTIIFALYPKQIDVNGQIRGWLNWLLCWSHWLVKYNPSTRMGTVYLYSICIFHLSGLLVHFPLKNGMKSSFIISPIVYWYLDASLCTHSCTLRLKPQW